MVLSIHSIAGDSDVDRDGKLTIQAFCLLSDHLSSLMDVGLFHVIQNRFCLEYLMGTN